MVKLSKAVLARQLKQHCYHPEDGDTLRKLVDKCGLDAMLDIQYDYSDCTVSIFWSQLETDEEYETRIESERQYKIAEAARKRNQLLKKEAEERELYERLKTKFG
jgi:hypothetical protein